MIDARQIADLQARITALEARSDAYEDLPVEIGNAGGGDDRPPPLTTVGVNGVAATITGSFGGATPYLWFNIAANTAEWKSSTLSPFPLDTLILDGRKGYPSEYWYAR